MLKSGDYDLKENSLMTMLGGNGDYYIIIESTIMDGPRKGLKQKEAVRICTSGGGAPAEVKIAAAKLHWAMENAGLNKP